MNKSISALAVMIGLSGSVCAQDDGAHAYPVLFSDSSEYREQINALEYESVLDDIKERRKKAKRRRRTNTLPELDPVVEECERKLHMLKATDRVLVVDSVVVDKRDFLSAYRYAEEVGTIEMRNGGETTEFVTERGNMSYRAEYVKGDTSKVLRLVTSYIENGEYVDTHQLKGFTMDGDANYPFMMSDGMTFYFAARGDEDGLGNYDLYATRYDSDTDRFYLPENMGFPYNSYANDYMLVIDETCNLGWFASDRYQPEGKVCIYMFVPNDSRMPVDYENSSKTLVRQSAMLRPIKSTWTKDNMQERVEARQRLSLANMHETNSVRRKDFELVINNLYTYYRFSDFKSEEARKQCRQWVDACAALERMEADLAEKRKDYHNASKPEKEKMKSSLIKLEQEYEKAVVEVKEAEKQVRNTENNFLN